MDSDVSVKMNRRRRLAGMGTPESRLHRLRQRGQGNFELAANYDYIHEGQRTLAKVYVGVGFQSLP